LHEEQTVTNPKGKCLACIFSHDESSPLSDARACMGMKLVSTSVWVWE